MPLFRSSSTMATDTNKFLHQVDTGKVTSSFRRPRECRGHPLVIVAQLVKHAPITFRFHVWKIDCAACGGQVGHEWVSWVHPSCWNLDIEYSPLDSWPWVKSIQVVFHLQSLFPEVHQILGIVESSNLGWGNRHDELIAWYFGPGRRVVPDWLPIWRCGLTMLIFWRLYCPIEIYPGGA